MGAGHVHGGGQGNTAPPPAVDGNGGGHGEAVDTQGISQIAAKVLPDSEKTRGDIQSILTEGNGYNDGITDEQKNELESVYLNSQVLNEMMPPDAFSSEAEAAEFWGKVKTAGAAGDGAEVRRLIEDHPSGKGNTFGLEDAELATTAGIDEHHTLHQNGNLGTTEDSKNLFNDAHKTKLMTVAADGLQVGDGYGNNNATNAQHGGWESSKAISETLGLGNNAMA